MIELQPKCIPKVRIPEGIYDGVKNGVEVAHHDGKLLHGVLIEGVNCQENVISLMKFCTALHWCILFDLMNTLLNLEKQKLCV